jgi:hypothetical protein
MFKEYTGPAGTGLLMSSGVEESMPCLVLLGSGSVRGRAYVEVVSHHARCNRATSRRISELRAILCT